MMKLFTWFIRPNMNKAIYDRYERCDSMLRGIANPDFGHGYTRASALHTLTSVMRVGHLAGWYERIYTMTMILHGFYPFLQYYSELYEHG
jgi:hypothetical protein